MAFGSRARQWSGTGRCRWASDLDLILTVSPGVFGAYSPVIARLNRDAYLQREDRSDVAAQVLGWNRDRVDAIMNGLVLDIFLMPENWLARIRSLSAILGNPGSELFNRIAVDTVRYNRALGHFERIPAAAQVYELGEHILYTYSAKLGLPVILADEHSRPQAIIEAATQLGGVMTCGSQRAYLVDLLPLNGHSEGPRFYTAEALLRHLTELTDNYAIARYDAVAASR